MSVPVVKASSQAAFRITSARACFGSDVTPTTLTFVLGFADSLVAEAEALALGDLAPRDGLKPTSPPMRVKVMTTAVEENIGKGMSQKVKPENQERICRFWGADDGCQKGQDCWFKHDWSGVEKKGKRFGCSASGHAKNRRMPRPMVQTQDEGSGEKQVTNLKPEPSSTPSTKRGRDLTW